ncbi:MAG: thioredoxin domain-containing protein [Brevundimonas sp.]|uniref:thioredoxin domain-containing protein n=1 Tax=Brevundimonas sp. TaxID=1871086 RepID=UPI00271FC25B|nr:thioredoxin domain-containing protein [Brevundimonas sp.]MDZ4317464.1 thioredoxin domain-containing protein [Phenylobacterium sp.]MDO9587510.1 thioredoxin domain-containing protein [Brevundimonas sp.]MDP3368687.1 thioredoxin domain-containing protein [Brevundimonas sp.]MDP3655862.1 thioredoxin domain-containing protein [Brevundimonas sp.]MDZ4112260.1 thioredoxin domain-containing protein [Brevundimonas sp.]
MILALLAPLALFPGAGASSALAQGAVAPVTGADRSIGRADAPVTVIEYASFSCNHCADWHRFVFPVFKQRLIDTGQVRLVFRNLPTVPEEVSLPGAALARCAAPERFFDVVSALMLGQDAVLRGGDRVDWYAPAIAVSGRTRAQIDACAATPATRDAINRDIESAHAAGAHSTPSFFVNGRRVTDRSLGGLEVAIRAAAAGQ